MIAKKFRLKEREVKRVLHKWKPFFSYGIVLNYSKNKLDYNKFAIVISKKSVKNSVERNFFRRKFYDFIFENIWKIKWYDFVFVVKNSKKFEKNDLISIMSFLKDLKFLISKIK